MDTGYRELALWAYGEECGVCGEDEEEVVVHHIMSGGMTDVLVDMIPLCRSHHQYVHHGLPQRDPHLARLQSMVMVQTTIPPGMVFDSRRAEWYYEGEYLTVEEAIAAARAIG